MENIFSVSTDIYSRKVVLTHTQLEGHIINESGHMEMADDPMSIHKTIEDPDYIYQSNQHIDREVYFGKGKHKDYVEEYVKVVVSYSNPDEGFVISAWTQAEVKGGIGEVKYAKTT